MSSIEPKPQQPYVPKDTQPPGLAGAGVASAVLEVVDHGRQPAAGSPAAGTVLEGTGEPASVRMVAVPLVYAAIAKAAAEIAKRGVGKLGTNEDQNYKFRSIDNVYGAVSAGLVVAGLVILPSVITRELVEHRTAAGKANWRVTLKMTYTFVAVADGSSHEVGPFFGEAFDTSDKATNKALTAAYKYMLIQVFCIPLEGIDDADKHAPEVESGSTVSKTTNGKKDQQRNKELYDDDLIGPVIVQELRARLEKEGIPEELFCTKGSIDSLEALPASNVDAAYHWIEVQLKKRAAAASPAPELEREPGSDDGLENMEFRTYGVQLAGEEKAIGTFQGKRLQVGGLILVADQSYKILELLKLDTQTPIIVAEPAQPRNPEPADPKAKKTKGGA